MAKLEKAKQSYNEMQARLDSYKAKIKDYNTIEEEYGILTGSYLNEAELAIIDRKEMYAMVDEDILKYVDLSEIVIKGNKMEITTAPGEWPVISKVVEILTSDPRISYVTTSYTQNKEKNDEDITANIVLIFVGGEENGSKEE